MTITTKPLNDNTHGFRFQLGMLKGLYRKRGLKMRLGISRGQTMTGFHLGKRSLYIEKRKAERHLGWGFAGQ